MSFFSLQSFSKACKNGSSLSVSEYRSSWLNCPSAVSSGPGRRLNTMLLQEFNCLRLTEEAFVYLIRFSVHKPFHYFPRMKYPGFFNCTFAFSTPYFSGNCCRHDPTSNADLLTALK